MAKVQTNQYKNEKRNQSRIFTREALFVNEYVKTKYQSIYNEAAEFYNELNNLYDRKPDLRKTYEFRAWKNQVAAGKGQAPIYIPKPKEYTCNRKQFRNISICPPTETTEKKCNTSNLLTMSLNIPLMAIPQHSTTEGITMQENQPADPPTVSTQESDLIPEDLMLIDPSITDQLMPEIVDKIISELQADPDIIDLLNGIDNFQEDLPEPDEPLEVEIPELELNDPLEDAVFW